MRNLTTPLLLLCLSLPSVHADIVWDGSTSGNWNTSSNWDLNRVPNTTENTVFPVLTANKAMANNRTAGTLFQKLVFKDDGYSLTGNALSLGTGGIELVDSNDFDGATTINLALLYYDLKEYEKAEELYRKTLKVYASIINYIPTEIELDIARFAVNIGNNKYFNNEFSEAEAMYLSAEETLSRYATENPDLYMIEWISVMINLANLHATRGDQEVENEYVLTSASECTSTIIMMYCRCVHCCS